jgi:hypothetical protein
VSARHAAAAAVALLVGALALPAGGQPAGVAEPEAAGEVALALEAVRTTVDPADEAPRLVVDLRVQAGPVRREDLRLVATALARVDRREDLLDAPQDEAAVVFGATAVEVEDLAAGTTRVVRLDVPAEELALVGEDRAGVYPLQLQLFSGGDPIGAVATTAVVLPDPGLAPDPLPVALLVRGAAAGAPLRDDRPHPSLLALVDPGGPVDRLAADLRAAAADGSAAGTTLALDGRLLEDLQGLADGWVRADGQAVPATDRGPRRAADALQALREAAVRADVAVAATPYGPADLVALVRGGLDAVARDLAAAGPAAVAGAVGPVDADLLLPPDGLDAAALAGLAPGGERPVVLEQRHVAIPDPLAMQPVRRMGTEGGGDVRVLVPDARLTELVAQGGADRPAALQQLLAETAAVWLDQRGAPSAEAVLLALDPLSPDGGGGSVADVGDAVAAAPWLRPVGVDTLASRVAPSSRPVRLTYPPASAATELPQDHIRALGDAHRALAPLRDLLPVGAPGAQQAAESLRAAASTAYRDPELRPMGRAAIADVTAQLADLAGGVAIAKSPPITLTAATGEVPVTVANGGTTPVRVVVTLRSPRFDFPRGAEQAVQLAPGSSQRLTFSARSRNPGGFAPIAVTVQDTGRQVVLARTQLSVRSTAFPVGGIVTAVGVAGLLLVRGIRQTRARRRQGRHQRPARPDAAAGAA